MERSPTVFKCPRGPKKDYRTIQLSKKSARECKKQAAQLGFCLSQAKEYFEAAESCSLATKPAQLYYGCMSLALGELLWKGDGTNSIDQLRKKHGHHGLELITGDLKHLDAAGPVQELRAKINNPSAPRGTFAAWAQVARNAPLAGSMTLNALDGATESSSELIYKPEDSPFEMFEKEGVSFLECIQCIPSFYHFLGSISLSSSLTRCTFNRTIKVTGEKKKSIVGEIKDEIFVHPNDKNRIASIAEGFKFKPNMFEKLRCSNYERGFILNLEYPTDLPSRSFQIPEGTSLNAKNTFLRQDDVKITEYGAYYVALYMVGMFCRYFPDIWMQHIERHTDFSIIVEHLCSEARERLPLILLSELDQVLYLLPD